MLWTRSGPAQLAVGAALVLGLLAAFAGTPDRARNARLDVEKPDPPQPEDSQHGGDDSGEHHLEHCEISEIELSHQLPRAAQAAALEAPAERDADDKRNEEAEAGAE